MFNPTMCIWLWIVREHSATPNWCKFWKGCPHIFCSEFARAWEKDIQTEVFGARDIFAVQSARISTRFLNMWRIRICIIQLFIEDEGTPRFCRRQKLPEGQPFRARRMSHGIFSLLLLLASSLAKNSKNLSPPNSQPHSFLIPKIWLVNLLARPANQG